MEGAGTRLKKIRLEKGLTLEEVQKKTRIHLNILKAIEEDGVASLSPVYIKGFMKIYCKFLGVEPREYISNYKETLARPRYIVPNKTPLQADKIFWLKLDSFISAVQSHFKAIIIVILIVIFALGLFNLGKRISFKRSPMTKRPASFVSTVNKTPAKHQDAKPEAVKLRNPDALKILRVGIRAKEDCLIRMKLDGKGVFQGILKKGREDSWEAKERIEFYLNNAKAVELQVNGERILSLGKAPGGKSQVNVLVDRNGVSLR